MPKENPFNPEALFTPTMVRRMLVGGTIALLLILFFLFGAGKPNPVWGPFWMIKPLILVPLAGAAGGAAYSFLDPLRDMGGWKALLANFIGAIVFLFILWMGTVLGLNGTYWD